MRFHFTLVSVFLFASTGLADLRRDRRTRFLNRVEQFENAASSIVEYSNSWSGAVWDKDNGTFTFVTGTFTVPIPSGTSGSAATAWVGIDGNSCYGGGLLQAGVDFNVNNNSEISYDAWYEWFPDWSYDFEDINVSAGDVIRVNISAFSSTSGLATIENLSNGQHNAKSLNSTYELCRQNAEWIVEDFDDFEFNEVPFANFSAVTFKDAMAFGPTGNYTPDGATVINLQKQNQTLTSVSINGSSITIKYV